MGLLPFLVGLLLGALIAGRYPDKIPGWLKKA